MTSWFEVKHFTAHELGSPGASRPEINQRLIALAKCLDIYRFKCASFISGNNMTSVRIPVHCGHQIRVNNPASQHNFGRAADIHVEQNVGTQEHPIWKPVDLFRQWIMAEACSVKTLASTMDFVYRTFTEYDGSVLSKNQIDSWIRWMEFVYQQINIESMFVGIGLYGEWAHPGLHLDMRGGDVARWVRIGNNYVALNSENLIMALEASYPRTQDTGHVVA